MAEEFVPNSCANYQTLGGNNFGYVQFCYDEGWFKKDIRDLKEMLSKLNPWLKNSCLIRVLIIKPWVGITSVMCSFVIPQPNSGNGMGFPDRREKYLGQGKKRMNSRTSTAQHEDVIWRTMYLSGINQQNLKISQKQEATKQCNCTIDDIENTLAKFMWAKEAQSKMQKLQEEGKPLPKSMVVLLQ
ncbi:hypothetical protein Drorol1_Dr00015851, partial [Drosera rotundifolia]